MTKLSGYNPNAITPQFGPYPPPAEPDRLETVAKALSALTFSEMMALADSFRDILAARPANQTNVAETLSDWARATLDK